jgi:hypothetical protein
MPRSGPSSGRRAGRRWEYGRLHEEDDDFLAFHVEHVIAKQHGGLDDAFGDSVRSRDGVNQKLPFRNWSTRLSHVVGHCRPTKGL